MKRSELEAILESKGLDKSVIPFFGGGVQVEINEGIASFRSINASALKHVQKQINEGGMISGQVLTYRLDTSSDMNESANLQGITLAKLSPKAKAEYQEYLSDTSTKPLIKVSKNKFIFEIHSGGGAEFACEVSFVNGKYNFENDGDVRKGASLKDVKEEFGHSELIMDLVKHIS